MGGWNAQGCACPRYVHVILVGMRDSKVCTLAFATTVGPRLRCKVVVPACLRHKAGRFSQPYLLAYCDLCCTTIRVLVRSLAHMFFCPLTNMPRSHRRRCLRGCVRRWQLARSVVVPVRGGCRTHRCPWGRQGRVPSGPWAGAGPPPQRWSSGRALVWGGGRGWHGDPWVCG